MKSVSNTRSKSLKRRFEVKISTPTAGNIKHVIAARDKDAAIERAIIAHPTGAVVSVKKPGAAR